MKWPCKIAAALVLVGLSCVGWADEAPYTFVVKGVIRAMPGDGRADNEILVKHEEIPEYRDSSGKIVGMMAMTMPFYLAPSASLKGISAGDAVELVVQQTLEPKHTERVVSITKAK